MVTFAMRDNSVSRNIKPYSIMSETKTYVFGEGGGNSQNSFDPNLLLGMMFGGGGFGGFGGGNMLWPLFLLFAWMRNGFGFGGNGGFCGCNNGYEFLSSQINNRAGQEFLMQAIGRNESAIGQLANMFGCKTGEIQAILNSLSQQICQFSNQTGIGQQQIINALERGDSSLAYQLSQNSCDIRNAIQACCCDVKGAIKDVAIGQERGFSSIAFNQERNKFDIVAAMNENTARILEGQRNAEFRELQRDLAERDREIAKKDVIINNAQQTATFGQMLTQATQPIYAAVNALQGDVDGIKCKLPKTVTLPFNEAQAIPNCLAYQLLGYPNLGFNNNGFV